MIIPDSTTTRIQAAQIVANGGVIACRTDTFYGLGVDPLNAGAVRKITKLKGSSELKPILLLLSDTDVVPDFIPKLPAHFEELSQRFWPGPLTLIGVANPELPEELTARTGTIGIRIPDDEEVRALVRACGGALTATSANPTGKAPARTAAEVEYYFSQGVDLIVDGGEVTATEPSTVVDLSGPAPKVIREGAIRRSELESVLFGQ